MGNDQVRFDMSVACLGDYKIIAPIREIQRKTRQVREYEQAYLAARGFSVSLENKSYSVNQNLLGITVSGAEIDQFKAPLCRHKAHYSFDDKKPTLTSKKQLIKLGFDKGNIVKFNQHTIGETISRQDFLTQLNQLADAYHVGEGIYCGDTTIGIKGRILFKAPALEVLMVAHRALEECVNSKSQNRFKASIAQKWCELVYEGLFFDPLKADLQAYLVSSQQKVTGQVTIELTKNNAIAIAVDSPNLLIESNATYAQSCDWSIEQAEGFIKLFGQSTRLACKIKNSNSALANIAESAGSHFNEGV
jgi:argininosuccinate synthase